jgi:hypothetical protein
MVKPVSNYFLDNDPSIYFSIIGGAMLLGTAFMLARRVRLLLFGSRAEGVVVALNRRMQQHRREKPSYMPVVRVHVKAEPVEFQSWTGGSGARFRPGDRVPVIYSPQTPKRALIANVFDLWAPPLAMAILGLGALAGAVKS